METRAHICQHETVTEDHAEAPPDLASRLKAELRRVWQIARAVLRGYLTGQPINESRPRKGCC
jgi:hypothetical protein